MDTGDAVLFAVGFALGWYLVRHRMKTGTNV